MVLLLVGRGYRRGGGLWLVVEVTHGGLLRRVVLGWKVVVLFLMKVMIEGGLR